MDTNRSQPIERPQTASGSAVWALGALMLLMLAVGGGFVVYDRLSNRAQPQGAMHTVRPVTENDHILGDIEAPIKLIVYTDLECPYCAYFHQEVQPALLEEYGDELAIVFRHFPLPSRPKGLVEAEAAECAYLLGGHDAFWGFVNTIYAVSPLNNGLDLEILPDIAHRIGLNAERFEACREEGGGSKRVQNDKFDGILANVVLTPSVLIQSEERSTLVAGSYLDRIRAGIEYVRAVSEASN